MHDAPGRSVYVSSFRGEETLPSDGNGAPVFLSLHISEEFSPSFPYEAERICGLLRERGWAPVADVSDRTLLQFGEPDIIRLVRRLGLSAVRFDCGFSIDEIVRTAERIPVFINASTVNAEDAARIRKAGEDVYAMHNFYPRPETGLDEDFFRETNERLRAMGLKVSCFIPGDSLLRGPIHCGLPTLEAHRNVLPSAAYADLVVNHGVDEIFVGDPGLSAKEEARMRAFSEDGILRIPAILEKEHDGLYGRIFTSRPDSPKDIVRFMESRMYASPGRIIAASRTSERRRGAITMDNEGYMRYSGEIQMIRTDRPADPRINVIGHVPEEAFLLMDGVKRGARFMLVRP